MKTTMPDLRQQKRALRVLLQERRAKAAAEQPTAHNLLHDLALKQLALPDSAIVASYSAYNNEMNPAPLAEALRARGHTIALPTITGKDEALLFRRYDVGDRLEATAHGILEPLPTAPTVIPDVLLVPLLGFDRRRHRLGYGGGFYDRTLAALRRQKPILAIGLGFACQELPEVPTGPHEAPLDKIATEIEIFEG